MLQLGQESTVKALDRTWTLPRLEVRFIEAFRDWIAEQVGDPFAVVERLSKFLPPEELLPRVKEAEAVARQLRCFSLACPLAKEYLATEAGMGKFAQLLLQEHHPDVTEGTALAVMAAAGPEWEKAMAKAKGKPRGNPASPG